jgi:4-nitrophenyl phosphatase
MKLMSLSLGSRMDSMIKGILFDLDGTVYRGSVAVPGAPEIITRLKRGGRRCLFVTNRSNRTPAEVASQLRGYGIPCEAEDVLTSAQATVQYLKKGTVFYIGEEGLRDAIVEGQLRITDQNPDYVVVSLDRKITYEKIEKATQLIRGGARFIATNPDMLLYTDRGLSPGTGVIVTAIAAATGMEPVFVGKPQTIIIDIALERLGVTKEEAVIVGDNLESDIRAGQNAGVRTILILTGVSTREDLSENSAKPTWVVENFDELEDLLNRI